MLRQNNIQKIRGDIRLPRAAWKACFNLTTPADHTHSLDEENAKDAHANLKWVRLKTPDLNVLPMKITAEMPGPIFR